MNPATSPAHAAQSHDPVPTHANSDVDDSHASFGLDERGSRPGSGLAFGGVSLAAFAALALSTRSGLGVALTLAAALLAMACSAGIWSSAGRWCLAATLLLPWLVIRDNGWLAVSIVLTVVAVLVLTAVTAATKQKVTDLSMGAVFRRTPPISGVGAATGAPAQSSVHGSVLLGVAAAVPVVAVFWGLLASADQVFASVVDPSRIPLGRILLFVFFLPTVTAVVRFAANGRSALSGKAHGTPIAGRFGSVESSIVLGSVSALFAAFIALRLATLGRPLEEEAWRSEVRSGFFQLLWVAALTVLLVLAIRQVVGDSRLTRGVRRLGWIAAGLAAVIDVLALMRIAKYVELSFLSPLRFWSFGFGLWLLVVLGITSLRMAERASATRWFTAAALASWMLFLFSLGVVNPDQRIAQHNFDSYDPTAESLNPDGEPVWIAVKPLMWLSEDATAVIVENIDVLELMPNDRYVRTVDHLCTRDLDESWRDWNLSRAAARDAIEELC